jgi:nucleoside-diphosphate-sugar epimerase
VRISSVYGPAFTRGFIYRAIYPKAEGNLEAPEKRDFIYVDDLNELLSKAAQTQTADSKVFDAASGESRDL